jgi:hypothetical protein
MPSPITFIGYRPHFNGVHNLRAAYAIIWYEKKSGEVLGTGIYSEFSPETPPDGGRNCRAQVIMTAFGSSYESAKTRIESALLGFMR